MESGPVVKEPALEEPAEAPGEFSAVAVQEASSSAFALGQPGADSAELAEVLLSSWLERDPAPLEARLNDIEDPLPMGQRRLLASFWQAVVGSPEAASQAASELRGNPDVTSAEYTLLRAAGEPAQGRPVPAASSRRDPLALAMRIVLLEDRGGRALSAQDWALAARSYSDLIQLDLSAAWAPHREALLGWCAALNKAQANHRLHPEGEWPSLEIKVGHGEGLTHIRQRALRMAPQLKICVGLIRQVNAVGRYLHPDQVLRIPTDVPNVLVDLEARTLVYRHGTEAVGAWAVGIGKEGHETPTGSFCVGEKLMEPVWMPIGAEQLPFGHPDNPLGTRWIAWFRDDAKTSYGFHGTWEPEGVGDRVSLGCIRMRNEGVEELFELLPVGSDILVQ